jgi:RNA-splicing ligase RtcB
MYGIKGKYTNAKVMIDDIDEETSKQIYEFVSHPAFTNPIAIMPDTHAGKGSVIGFTMKVTDKIVPNVIGVDIGCGMLSINIGNDLKFSLETIDKIIKQTIPTGFRIHSKVSKLNRYLHMFQINSNHEQIMEDITFVCKLIGIDEYKAKCALGTLGGGNHFIEIGKDLNDEYWLTIHTGSRNFGKCVCDYYQKQAIDLAEQERETFLNAEKIRILANDDKSNIQTLLDKAKQNYGVAFENKTLRYLTNDLAKEYLSSMYIAQNFAKINRYLIAYKICACLNWLPKDTIESIHNYIDPIDNIIRKGAIRSYVGERMIIPFNMRDGILICEGKSNPEWNYSAPHGAGRVLSRSQAKQKITLEDFQETMVGIYSTSINTKTIDESPFAYKDSKIIEEAIEPTTKIINRIKPILNIKDCGD